MSGAARSGLVGLADPGRHPEDFYRTEAYATHSLITGLKRERVAFDGVVVDPACGDGAIMQVFAERGHHMFGSDLVFRGVGVGGVDFLDSAWRQAVGLPVRPAWIVANPPYRGGLPLKMLLRALDEATVGVAFLVRHGWLPPAGVHDKPFPRWDMIEDVRLAYEIHVGRMSYLPPEKDKGQTGFADFVWLVFLQNRKRRGVIRLHHTRLNDPRCLRPERRVA
jgi:hypothetical protein